MVTLRGGYASNKTVRADMTRSARREVTRRFMEAPDVQQALAKLASSGKAGEEETWRACCLSLAQKGEEGVALAVDSAWARFVRDENPDTRLGKVVVFDEHFKSLFLMNPKRAEAFIQSRYYATEDLDLKAVLTRYMPQTLRARLCPHSTAPAYTA